jgi:hypothetical protein
MIECTPLWATLTQAPLLPFLALSLFTFILIDLLFSRVQEYIVDEVP